MYVILKNDWFAPNATLYRYVRGNRKTPVQIPDDLRPFLPADAVVVGAKPPVVQAPAPVTLRDYDLARAAGEAEDRAMAQAIDEAVKQAEKRLPRR